MQGGRVQGECSRWVVYCALRWKNRAGCAFAVRCGGSWRFVRQMRYRIQEVGRAPGWILVRTV